MFVQIRGTFGSGKTTVARNIMRRFEQMKAQRSKVMLHGFEFAQKFENMQGIIKPVFVIGKYDTAANCGADSLKRDGVNAAVLIEQFIEKNAKKAHIILEGSFVIVTRFIKLGQRLQALQVDSIYRDLATPVDLCVSRVAHRRKQKWIQGGKKGELKVVNPAHIISKSKSTESMHRQTLAAGLNCCWIQSDMKHSLAIVRRLRGLQLR